MSKIKSLKIKLADGTFSEAISLGADAANIDMADGKTLEAKVTEIETTFDNYYDKNSINTMIGDLSSLDIQVVETLPTTDISTSTIYLKLNEKAATDNIYDEYIYVNSKWEIIGSTAVDLSNYYTKDNIDLKLNSKANQSNFLEHAGNYEVHINNTERTTWNGKQDALVSGTNIKTINNESILGTGNITLATEEKEVAISTIEPTDEDTKIWINPSEETSTEVLAAVAFSGNYSDLNGLPDLSNVGGGDTTALENRIAALEAKQTVTSSTITKIEKVTEYPETQEAGTLYIKVAS